MGYYPSVPDPILLHVEDEDAAAFLLETTLQEAGIAVQLYRVSDGEQALAFLGKTGVYQKAPTPDMVLLDLNLPRLTGFQVLERLKKEGSNHIPVTVFTSSRLASDRTNALALGAKQYITKPSDLDAFMEAVREACASLRRGERL
jgi:CheY-like chemotaxis protein